jgi:NAD(P) transhydrogenase subunit alpha
MKLLAIKENNQNEKRVALTPDVIAKYQKFGLEVFVESEAGKECNFSDVDYEKNGAKIVKNINEILPEIDIIIAVQRHDFDYAKIKPNAIFLALLNPYFQKEVVNKLANFDVNAFALELLPRITRAQSMDILSSQSNLTGYRAVIDAVYEMNNSVPMMITSAGTISAAKFLILGAGVAGLQAIATAKRIGAIVSAFDVRASAKEQVQSLGAKFIEVKSDEKTDGVYAQEMSEEYKVKQQQLLEEIIKSQDVVISTALIPGKKAPILITEKMVNSMKPNSIIIDLSAVNGGNCELTKPNQIVTHNNVKFFGYENYPSRIALDASKFFAKNILNFVELLIEKDKKLILINRDDEIIKATLICSNKTVINEKFVN